MSNQLQVIQPKIIPQSQGNFVLIKMPEGYRGHLHCLDFVIETNYKVIDAKIAYLLGISHEWCTEYIGGEQNFTKFKVKALYGIYGVLDCITVEQFHILCSKARNTRADKYQPKLLELISQVLPLTRHDDKENQIMTTNQLININQQQIGDQQVNAVSARELHKFLESKRKFTDWVKPYVSEDNDYGFVQGIDFIRTHAGVNPTNNTPLDDYWFTIDMAKEVSMLSKTEKGKQARKYFIECERKANNPQIERKSEPVKTIRHTNASAMRAADRMIEKMTISDERKTLARAYLLQKEYDIPVETMLPTVVHKLSATEIGKQLGISANMVGRITNELHIKDNPELCERRLDKLSKGLK